MDRTERIIAGIELCNINRQSSVLFEFFHDAPGCPDLINQVVRSAHFMIQIPAFPLRFLSHICMSGQEVHRQLPFPAAGQKITHPFQRSGSAADRRSSDTNSRNHTPNSLYGDFVEPEVCLFVRILPEPRKVRFIPDLDRPQRNFFPAVAFTQMLQCCLNQGRPSFLLCRRCNIGLPVKQCLVPTGHLGRHEPKFQHRSQAKFPVTVHYPVQICKAILIMPDTVRIRYRCIDRHSVGKKPMTTDMPEMA